MKRRLGVLVFLTTFVYQLLDASAVVIVPQYDRGGLAATLLFWALPMSVAFVLSYQSTPPSSREHDRWLHGTIVLGAAAGQAIGLLVVFPTDVIPQLTVSGIVILTALTALFVLCASVGGATTAHARGGNPPFSRRLALFMGSLCLLAGLTHLINPARGVADSIFEYSLAGWLFAIAYFTDE